MRDVISGSDNASDYVTYLTLFIPTTAQWYAEIISNATYVLDGVRYFPQRNDANSTMHSGTNGWSYRVWNLSEVSKSSITFTLCDESNSSMDMPGLVLGKVTYTCHPYTWSIKLTAVAPAHRTPLMLTNHAYWNLDAFANPDTDLILNHTLSLPFSWRVISTEKLWPTRWDAPVCKERQRQRLLVKTTADWDLQLWLAMDRQLRYCYQLQWV